MKTLDLWTLVHLLSGGIMAATGVRRPIAYGLVVGVEVLEFALRSQSEFFKESPANIAADVGASIGAYELVRLGQNSGG